MVKSQIQIRWTAKQSVFALVRQIVRTHAVLEPKTRVNWKETACAARAFHDSRGRKQGNRKIGKLSTPSFGKRSGGETGSPNSYPPPPQD